MRAVLDACVLYPTLPRTILIGCAAAGLIAPLWSARILEEWRRAVLRNLPEQAAAVEAEIATLTARFPKAMGDDAGDLAETLSLPDADDRHVLATAIAARADALVTFNLTDFPGRALARHGVLPRHPDGLLCELHDDARDPVRAVVAAALAPLGDVSARALLKRAKLPRFAKAFDGARGVR